MSRSSHASRRRPGGPRWLALVVARGRGAPRDRACVGLAPGPAPPGSARPRSSSADRLDPRTPPARSCPARRSAASPASRSTTARPACPSWSPATARSRPGRLTLAQPTNSQRSFFNGFFGTPPEARLAILRRVPGTNPPRYNLRTPGRDQGPHALPRPDGQVRLQPEGRKERHRRHHRADLGPDLRPGPARQQRLARQPRTRQLHQLDRHPPGRTPGEGRPPRDLRLQVHDGAPALHGHVGRG